MRNSAEDLALNEVGATRMERPAGGSLLGGFLACILSVAALILAGRAERPLPEPGAQGFEEALQEASPVRSEALDLAWAVLGPLGAASSDVFPGREGWLFYRPDVEHLTGPAFEIGPPVEAVAGLARELKRRGVHLIVLPTPVKPAVHPEKLVAAREGPLRNPSFSAYLREVRKADIDVLDLALPLDEAKRSGSQNVYLATDTHWTPSGVDAAARRVAGRIRAEIGGGGEGYERFAAEVANTGDTARMLEAPGGAATSETVVIQQVVDSQGQLWKPRPEAPVLLLGDSFSNIYSLPGMGWGNAAGLAAQISFHSGHPLDAITQNDQGAFATRFELRRRMKASALSGTRIVLYQFAARELSFGQWRPL